MRTTFAIAALCCPVVGMAQIASSASYGCTVVHGGMNCDGLVASSRVPSVAKSPIEEGKKGPTLSILDIRLEPGASFKSTSFPGDCVLLGINGGGLLNEMPPFRHVDLDRNTATLMPRELPFRLRNNSSKTVEFRVIEIQR